MNLLCQLILNEYLVHGKNLSFLNNAIESVLIGLGPWELRLFSGECDRHAGTPCEYHCELGHC